MKIRSFIALILFTVSVVQAAAGPGVQSDWATVQALASGTKVKVETKDKQSYYGKIAQVSDAAAQLTLDDGRSQSVKRDDIKRLYRYEPGGGGSRAKSAGIFGAIGAGVGAAIGGILLGATGGSDETGKVIAPFIIGGAAAGAGLGAALGRGQKKVLVYHGN